MVLVVSLKMLVEAVDSVGQNSDLNLGRTGIALVSLLGVDNKLLFFLCHNKFTSFFSIRQTQQAENEVPETTHIAGQLYRKP